MPSSVIRTVIADDEPLARKKINLLVASEPGIQVVAECKSGKQTVCAVLAHKPDLLLLDVQMPDMDGFQVMSAIPANEMPVVIFTTAYDQYAIRAFEAHALDYLLKPFDQERLHHALERARAELAKTENREMTHRILQFLEKAKTELGVAKRIVIKGGGRVVFLELDEIEWVEAAANYVKLNTSKDSYLLREGIGRVSERLDPGQFIRIHRSVIVNVRKIKELQTVNSGEYIVVLRSGRELPCSRGYRSGLQRLIDKNV